MKTTLLGIAVAASFVAAPAYAQSGEDLLRKNGCTACHAVDKKIVGPSYKEVSTKYKGQKDAQQKLADKIKRGGAGAWGPVPMPPNPTLSDGDIATMVKYVLAL